MSEKSDIIAEIKQCRRYAAIIEARNQLAEGKFKENKLSKDMLHNIVSKNNYWLNYYDGNIKECKGRLQEMWQRQSNIRHNLIYLFAFITLFVSIPAITKESVTGLGVKIVPSFALNFTTLTVIGLVFMAFSYMFLRKPD